MLDAQRLVNAILSSRGAAREPNDQEVSMVHVALSGEEPPETLNELLTLLDDPNRFDFSVDFGLTGHLLNAAQEAGDETLEAFTARWAPENG